MHLQNFEKLQSRKKRRKFSPHSRVFACGEDSLALRLASQLADLRAANADLHPALARNRFEGATPANTKGTPAGAFCVGWGSRIRTYECQSQSLVPYRLAIPQNITFLEFLLFLLQNENIIAYFLAGVKSKIQALQIFSQFIFFSHFFSKPLDNRYYAWYSIM